MDGSRGVEGGATLAFPAFRLIVSKVKTKMVGSGGNLYGLTWCASIAFVLTAWWS